MTAAVVLLALVAGCTTRTLRVERDAARFRVYSRYGAETRVRAPIGHLRPGAYGARGATIGGPAGASSRGFAAEWHLPLRVGRAEVEVPVERLRRLAVGGLDQSGRLFVTVTHESGKELGGTVPAGLTVVAGSDEVALRDLDFLELGDR